MRIGREDDKNIWLTFFVDMVGVHSKIKCNQARRAPRTIYRYYYYYVRSSDIFMFHETRLV